jgi:predicted ester cyclase
MSLSPQSIAQAYVQFMEGTRDSLTGLMSEDFYDNVSERTGPGIWAVVRQWLDQSFAEVEVDLHAAASDDDKVLVWVTVHGTHIGSAFPWMGDRPASGRRVAWKQLHVFRVAGEMVVEHWAVRDDLRVLRAIDAA